MENRPILNIILVSILVLYVFVFIYVLVVYVIPKVKKDNEQRIGNIRPQSEAHLDVISPVATEPPSSCSVPSTLPATNNTDFFIESVKHAEKTLYGKMFLEGYRYGYSVDLTRLDEETKKSIVITMQYMMIDPLTAKNNEHNLRLISQQEGVPLYFVILHSAIKKLIPVQNKPVVTDLSDNELLLELERRNLNFPLVHEENKIVSINKVA